MTRDTWTRRFYRAARTYSGQWRCHLCRAYNYNRSSCHKCGYTPTWQ